MAIWEERLLKIRTLRGERTLCDQRLYAIQNRRRKAQDALWKIRKQETTLPADTARILALKKDIDDLETRFQQLGLALAELEGLAEKVAASDARLSRLDQQLQSFDLRDERADTRTRLRQEREDASIEAAALRERLQTVAARQADITAERRDIRAQLARQSAALAAGLRDNPPAPGDGAGNLAAQEEEYQEAKRRLKASRQAVDQAIADLYRDRPDVPPRDLVANLADDIPFLLMPVRIETRFMTAARTPELWLRVYPDDIAIHTHESVLTDREVAEGEKYWRTLWGATQAGGAEEEAQKRAAWGDLADQFGSQRAGWVARQTRPTNWDRAKAEPDPIFPHHELTKTSSWSRAPRTTAMPDKFVVMLYEGDKVVSEVTGRHIPDELFVGPDPLEPDESFVSKDDKLLFGEAFDWASDFPKAVELGMGFKIPITAQQAVAGFSKVLVLGLSLSADASAGKEGLEALIDSHHYSPKGLSLVRQGTATNNTDAGGAGFTKNDQFNAVGYVTETGAPLFGDQDDTDGRHLADALGIGYAPLQYVLNSDATDRRDAIAMNTAMYPATLGYYFDTLMEPVLSAAAQETLRDFFVRRVSGRGPLPAIRVGNQPYGILLTSDFSNWHWSRQEAGNNPVFLQTLQQTVQKYHAVWLGLLDKVNFVGKPGTEGDPSAVLMDVLGLQAGSVSFHQRIGYSTDYLRNLDSFHYGGRYFDDLRQNFDSKNKALVFLASLGYSTADEQGKPRVPQLLRLLYQHYHTALDANNLIDSVPLSENDAIRYYDEAAKKNYLHWLAEAKSIVALEQQDFGAGRPAPNALLYLQLRRALLLQLHKSAVQWLLRHQVDLTPTLAATNFYNIRPEISLTKWETMKAKVAVAVPGHPDNGKAVSDYLLGAGKDQAEADFLNQLRGALHHLARLPTASLERCFTEHLDTCTYRLDSWQSAMFGLRLEQQRQREIGVDDPGVDDPGVDAPGADGQGPTRKTGIYAGAYGWLENLRPRAQTPAARGGIPDQLIPANGEPLYEDPNSGGFVHAPSLNQASAAAVLRSGYLTDARSSHPDSMAVNLSSARIRRALFILQGIRNGQALEALLGYQFERDLHDAASADAALIGLNAYIYDFRDTFPLEQHHLRQQGSDAALESIAANNVVNGVRLAEAAGGVPYGAGGAVSAASAGEKAAIGAAKDRLSDSLDAVKDLLQSESVYQMVQGNFDRAAAVVNALQESNVPPEIEIINTPRSSHFSFTNRVTLQFAILDPDAAASNPWSPIAMSPRARVEPGLNAWLGKLLGSPAALFCRVAQLDAGGNPSAIEAVAIDQLGIQPIDLVYLVGNELNTGAAQAGGENNTAASELESRIAWYYRGLKGLDDDAAVRIEFLQPAAKRTLGKLMPLLRMLKGVITDARPLHAQDFDPPSKLSVADKHNPEGYAANELGSRIQAFELAYTTPLAAVNGRAIDAVVPDKDGNLQHHFTLLGAFTALQGAHLGFADIAYTFADTDLAWLQGQLLKVAELGVPDAFPRQRLLTDARRKALLLDQAMGVALKMGLAAASASALLAAANAAPAIAGKVELRIAAGKALMGEMFRLLPRFTYNNEADLQASHADRPQLLQHATGPLKMRYPAEEWLHGVAHVRPKLARWDYVLSLHEAFNGERLSLLPVQLPYRAKDSWLAVEFPLVDPLPPAKPFNIEHDTLCVTVHGDAAFAPASAQCGLLIDDWTEVIPTRGETTGIAFHYDQPNAAPPQALLLAVPSAVTGHWRWDDLVGILNDTLLRAKLRAVEPQLLDQLDKAETGVLLPAILADFSQRDLNVALDYRLNISYVNTTAPISAVTKTIGA